MADPVDFEEMAAEQNRCPETQRLLGGSSLKLAFSQIGAQRIAGDVSIGVFHLIIPLKFRKIFFHIFTMLLTPGGFPPFALFHLDLFDAGCLATSPPGLALALAASWARSIATHAYHPSPSSSLDDVFLTFTLTWWDLCNTEVVLIVPDERSRILEVVVVRRILVWVLVICSGEGMGKGEKGEVSLQATWDRGGQDPVTARRVSKFFHSPPTPPPERTYRSNPTSGHGTSTATVHRYVHCTLYTVLLYSRVRSACRVLSCWRVSVDLRGTRSI